MARTKSEQKRLDIIRVAAELFEELGYERTSMNLVAERLGGSKQTLYNYFRSKDELLRAVLQLDVSEGVEMIVDAFRGEKTLKKALVRLGAAFLNRRLGGQQISNYRIVASQPAESKLGIEFFETALRPGAERICHLFEQLMDQGQLKRAKPWLAVMQWKGLIEQDLFERRLLGTELDQEEIESAAKSGTDAFLTIYGTDSAPRKKSARRA
jgi:AcrR family transcriptional regulator